MLAQLHCTNARANCPKVSLLGRCDCVLEIARGKAGDSSEMGTGLCRSSRWYGWSKQRLVSSNGEQDLKLAGLVFDAVQAEREGQART